jgi:hypothetical protein
MLLLSMAETVGSEAGENQVWPSGESSAAGGVGVMS